MSDQEHPQSNNAVEEDQPQGVLVSVSLEFDNSTNELSAVLTDAIQPSVIDMAFLRGLIAEQGYSELFYAPDALEQLLYHIADDKRGHFPLGKKLDARVDLAVPEDAMTVLATTTPAFGGKPLDQTTIHQAVTSTNIDPACLDGEAIKKLTETTQATDIVIGRGSAAEDGSDSWFEALVQGVIHHAPTKAERGNVDQFDVSEFVVVEPGAELMRLHPATPGRDGIDVYGKVIAATPGKHSDFARNLAGVAISDTDGNLLLAETKGHPVVMANGVRMDEVIKLPAADLRSGNIRFDGSVYIAGDVAAGVEIYASGDVTVKGVIEHATIEAGGSIFVGIGVVNPEPHGVGPVPEGVHLKAADNIQAKYVSGAWLEAGGDIIVKEYIAHSVTETAGHVLVGQSGGQGRIFGGRCHGRSGINANRLGSNASVETLISAGLRTPLHDAKKALKAELKDLAIQTEKIESLVNKLHCEPPGQAAATANETCVKLYNTLTMVAQKSAKANARLAAMDEDLHSVASACISTAKGLRANVTLSIHGVSRTFAARETGGVFRLIDEVVTRSE